MSSDNPSSDEDDENEELYFAVAANKNLSREEPVEMDIIRDRCNELRQLMRLRPTLPMRADERALSVDDLKTGARLPLYSCPFKQTDGSPCNFHTNDRSLFIHHVAGGVSDSSHYSALNSICKDTLDDAS